MTHFECNLVRLTILNLLISFQGMQIYMRSERGKIKVYLCLDDDSEGSPCLNSPIKHLFKGDNDSTADSVSSLAMVKPETSSGTTSPMMLSSQTSQRFGPLNDNLKFALIAATPDFGPIGSSRIQLETLDQDPCGEIWFSEQMLVNF